MNHSLTNNILRINPLHLANRYSIRRTANRRSLRRSIMNGFKRRTRNRRSATPTNPPHNSRTLNSRSHSRNNPRQRPSPLISQSRNSRRRRRHRLRNGNTMTSTSLLAPMTSHHTNRTMLTRILRHTPLPTLPLLPRNFPIQRRFNHSRTLQEQRRHNTRQLRNRNRFIILN